MCRAECSAGLQRPCQTFLPVDDWQISLVIPVFLVGHFYLYWTLLDQISSKVWALCRKSALKTLGLTPILKHLEKGLPILTHPSFLCSDHEKDLKDLFVRHTAPNYEYFPVARPGNSGPILVRYLLYSVRAIPVPRQCHSPYFSGYLLQDNLDLHCILH